MQAGTAYDVVLVRYPNNKREEAALEQQIIMPACRRACSSAPE